MSTRISVMSTKRNKDRQSEYNFRERSKEELDRPIFSIVTFELLRILLIILVSPGLTFCVKRVLQYYYV